MKLLFSAAVKTLGLIFFVGGILIDVCTGRHDPKNAQVALIDPAPARQLRQVVLSNNVTLDSAL